MLGSGPLFVWLGVGVEDQRETGTPVRSGVSVQTRTVSGMLFEVHSGFTVWLPGGVG
ncbi:MAG: hypothetical protein JWO36_1498 [Myxococcales bacterium]|nr:hypothetical protein [Myxococcales bacterium]